MKLTEIPEYVQFFFYSLSLRKLKAASFVIKDVTLIPMTEAGNIEITVGQTSVFICNGKIAAIGPFEEMSIPDGMRIIDATGKYLLPGFSDMHVHFTHLDELKLYLANGVTRIRAMVGFPWYLMIRKLILQKRLLGPSFITVGPLLDGEGSIWPFAQIVETLPHARKAVRDTKKKGYSAVKIYDRLKPDVFDEIMKTAKEEHIPVVGHVPWNVGFKNTVQAGLFSNEHLTGYSVNGDENSGNTLEEEIALTLEKGVWNCPTLIVLHNYENLERIKTEAPPEGMQYLSPAAMGWWSEAQPWNMEFEKKKTLLLNLHQKGAKLVSGTDVGNPYVVPGFSLHDEFEYMHDAGLTPYEVLKCSTVHAAAMMGEDTVSGSIEVGKKADLVLLEKNPLEDIRNTRTIAGVVRDGRWISKEDLAGMLKGILDKKKKA
ncbi:MAG: amidohydrolase family protein [Spirochaetales bacterium]|nr:amidohydrolase family protein [Spirochaetales bacterium]